MKVYIPGMISLILIPTILIPIFYLVFNENDLRILKFNIPTTDLNDNLQFPTYDLYDGVALDSFPLDSMDLITMEMQFDKLACLRSDSEFLSKKPSNFKKGIMFKISNKTNYQAFINLISLSEKYKFKFYGLDLKNDNFIVSDIFNENKIFFTRLGGCIVYGDLPKTRLEIIKELIEEKTIPFRQIESFKYLFLAYLFLIYFIFKFHFQNI